MCTKLAIRRAAGHDVYVAEDAADAAEGPPAPWPSAAGELPAGRCSLSNDHIVPRSARELLSG